MKTQGGMKNISSLHIVKYQHIVQASLLQAAVRKNPKQPQNQPPRPRKLDDLQASPPQGGSPGGWPEAARSDDALHARPPNQAHAARQHKRPSALPSAFAF